MAASSFAADTRIHVLLVERNDTQRQETHALLTSCGYLVTAVTNRRQAAALLTQVHGGGSSAAVSTR